MFVFVCEHNVFVCVHNVHSLLLRGSFRNAALAVCTTPRCKMADSNKPKKRAGRPVKKKRGKPKAQNVPGEKEQKVVREKGRKRMNYLAKKGVCEGFDPGDDGGEGGGTIIIIIIIM